MKLLKKFTYMFLWIATLPVRLAFVFVGTFFLSLATPIWGIAMLLEWSKYEYLKYPDFSIIVDSWVGLYWTFLVKCEVNL